MTKNEFYCMKSSKPKVSEAKELTFGLKLFKAKFLFCHVLRNFNLNFKLFLSFRLRDFVFIFRASAFIN